jgi:hypothetical protein
MWLSSPLYTRLEMSSVFVLFRILVSFFSSTAAPNTVVAYRPRRYQTKYEPKQYVLELTSATTKQDVIDFVLVSPLIPDSRS